MLDTPRPGSVKIGRHYPFLMSGEAFVASVGIAAAAVLVVALACTSWWIVRSQRTLLIDHRTQQVRAVAELVSQSTEALMASDGMSPVRRLVVEISQKHKLGRCRVVLPDGEVIADSDPAQITVKQLPAVWPQGPIRQAVESRESDQIVIQYPLKIVGRGTARLEITAPLEHPFWMISETLGGIGVIGAVALAAVLFGYRHLRSRLGAMVMIREALFAYQGDETPTELMNVNPEFGKEAVAWNDLLAQMQKLRQTKLAQDVKETLGAPQRVASNLDEACNSMSQGMILLDEQLNVHYANGAAAVFAKADRQKMNGAAIDEFFDEPDVLDAIRSAADASLRSRSAIEVQQSGEGDRTVLRFSVRPVRRNDPGAVMVIIDDVTQQRMAEQARNDFVAQVAHELRAPLSNIRLYVESMLDDDLDDAARSESVNVINLETKRLANLVSDMLSVSEIEAGSMQIQSDDIYLERIFKELEADYKPKADEKELQLTFSLPPKLPVIQADHDKLVMAIHNLVGNAVKYTPNGGQVDVNVDMSADQFVMEISDTGIGISPEDQAKIFDKFYRARNEQMEGIPGTGLGLSLAREVVRLHGGEISVESETGKGTTFTLSLPIQVQAA